MRKLHGLLVVLLIAYTLSAPYLMAIYEIKSSYVWPTIVSGAAILIVMLRYKDIKSISLFKQLNIEMAEKINEAESIIKNLKLFASSLAEHSLTDLMAGCFGFQGGIDRSERFKLKNNIIKTLVDMGFDNSEIQKIEENSKWKNGVCMIYWNAISHILEKRSEKNHVNFKEPERRATSERISLKMREESNSFTEWEILPAETIRSMITEDNIEIDARLQEWLEDYANYLRTGKIEKLDELLKGNY